MIEISILQACVIYFIVGLLFWSVLHDVEKAYRYHNREYNKVSTFFIVVTFWPILAVIWLFI